MHVMMVIRINAVASDVYRGIERVRIDQSCRVDGPIPRRHIADDAMVFDVIKKETGIGLRDAGDRRQYFM
jgi:hypothetical protein